MRIHWPAALPNTETDYSDANLGDERRILRLVDMTTRIAQYSGE